MHYLNSLKQLVCCERMSEVFSSATNMPSVSLSKFFCQTSSVFFSKSIHTFFVTRSGLTLGSCPVRAQLVDEHPVFGGWLKVQISWPRRGCKKPDN